MNEPTATGRQHDRGPSDDELRDAVPPGASGNELQVGIFVLLGLLSFLAVLFLTTDPAYFRGRYHVTTTVDHAGGVRQGDPVQMRGVNIGRVSEFALLDDGMVQIVLEVEGQWEIPEDSHTEITGTGLLGGRTIEVVPGESERNLPSGANLPGSSAGDLMDRAESLGGEAQLAIERVRELLSEPTVSSLQASARELDSLLSQLTAFTREQRGEIDRLTRSLNRSAEGLEQAAAGGPDVARAAARADSVLERLNRTGATLDRTAVSLESVMSEIERGRGTLGQLTRNDSLYVNLNRAAESIYLLATDLRENPGRYVTIEIF